MRAADMHKPIIRQALLAAMRQDGGTVDDADWIAAIDHAVSRLRSQPPAEAQPVGGGEVFGWVLGDAFVDARFWTAGTPPQGWTPVYRTAPPSAPVGVVSAADAVMAVPELQDMACIGSMSPAEHALGLLQQALAQQPAAVDGADTRRMDWLDGVAHCADWDDSGHDVMRRVIRADDGAEFCADTWREAIDTALAAQQGGRSDD